MHGLVCLRKPCLRFINRLSSLKHAQHFDTHNSNQKKEKENNKRRKYSVYNSS